MHYKHKITFIMHFPSANWYKKHTSMWTGTLEIKQILIIESDISRRHTTTDPQVWFVWFENLLFHETTQPRRFAGFGWSVVQLCVCVWFTTQNQCDTTQFETHSMSNWITHTFFLTFLPHHEWRLYSCTNAALNWERRTEWLKKTNMKARNTLYSSTRNTMQQQQACVRAPM